MSTTIKFKNGSEITTLDTSDTIRSRPRIYELIDLREYHWRQRLYLRFLDTELVRRIHRYKR
jgi:hypothetical protein